MPEVTVGTNPQSVAIGDFNGDGIQDFAAANDSSNNVSIRLGGCFPFTIGGTVTYGNAGGTAEVYFECTCPKPAGSPPVTVFTAGPGTDCGPVFADRMSGSYTVTLSKSTG